MQRRREVGVWSFRIGKPGAPGAHQSATFDLRAEIVDSETGTSPIEFLSSLEFKSGYFGVSREAAARESMPLTGNAPFFWMWARDLTMLGIFKAPAQSQSRRPNFFGSLHHISDQLKEIKRTWTRRRLEIVT